MGNPGAQHELACTLVQRYPKLTLRLGEIAGVKFPDHDLAVAASNSHQLPDRPPLDGDGTIRFLRDGRPTFFAQVEVQREHTDDKYATLRAYHGSEVSKAQADGHMFVVSPKLGETAKFRRSESSLSEEYAYRGSYLSHRDLEPMAAEKRPFEERCFAIGMTDFSREVPETAAAMLREAADKDVTIANLFFRTIAEEVPDVSMMEAVLQPDILKKLRGSKAFRDYEEGFRAEIAAEAAAAAKEAIAKAEAATAKAEEDAKRAQDNARQAQHTARQAQHTARQAQDNARQAEAVTKADDLSQFFFLRGDKPSVHALDQISACTNVGQLNSWLRRAYAGETSSEIFPEP